MNSARLLITLAVYEALAKATHRRTLTNFAEARPIGIRGLLVWVAWLYLGVHLLFPKRVP